MGGEEHGPQRLTYPAPCVVLGVGRLGLAVLEHLGRDWYDLSQAGADASLNNLRLLHVAAEDDQSAAWRDQEEQTTAVAAYVGESDLPSLALDLAILRSLGLVRYRDGSYQVAMPQDAGVVDTSPAGSDGAGRTDQNDPAKQPKESHLQRRRYFAWYELSPDPVVAAEALKRLTDRDSELDLFVTPILNRVRQGHSPRTVLACVARAAALREGRDPSPWRWLWRASGGDEGGRIERWQHREDGPIDLHFTAEGDDLERAVRDLGLEPDLRLPDLESFAPVPLPGWISWLSRATTRDPANSPGAVTGEGKIPASSAELHLRIPPPFVPHPADTPSWLQPSLLLRQDWANTGWVTDVTTTYDYPPFTIVQASPFRLGLFDHDSSGSPEFFEHLQVRLKHLGGLVHQGLIRMWVDLQRERVEERHPVLFSRRREHDEEALRQSLEILGELLVRRLFEPGSPDAAPDSGSPNGGSHSTGTPDASGVTERSVGDDPLPNSASRFLSSIELELQDRGTDAAEILAHRLEALGLDDGGPSKQREYLLQEVRLSCGTEQDCGEIRHLLNQAVRQLFDIENLAAYRDWPTRRPPRLTVFLVGDMGEPFVRTMMRPLLREVHAELLRAFGPILEYFREDFDRGMSVTPILWTPHPADPFEGGGDEAGRCEEAAIISSIHGIRRWVESVIPPTRRRVSQIFINSRVSDMAVLDQEDAVRQTRDFLTLQVRNDLSQDEWLRRIAEGPPGDDFFSSFTCYGIDFPAEKSREYLANRLARHALRHLKTLKSEEVPTVPEELLRPPRLDEDVASARNRLLATIQPAAQALAGRVEERRARIDRTTPLHQIEADFDHGFEERLLRQIQRDWRAFSRDRGDMDHLVDRLRIQTSELLSHRVSEVQRHGDQLIQDHAGHGGVQTALAGFNHLRQEAFEMLEQADRVRLNRENAARHHTVPATDRIRTSRERVVSAASDRPEERPTRFGLLLWLLLAPVLGAPLAHAVAYLLNLHREPNLLELALGPGGWLLGGALLFLAGWGAVRWYQGRLHQRLVRAVTRMAAEARRVVEGVGLDPEQEPHPSIRSFLETRLLLAEGLAWRGFSLQVFERIEGDHQLAKRLNRSIDVQTTRLARQAEDLGVRPTLGVGAEGTLARDPDSDDLGHLFTPQADGGGEHLIAAKRLVDLYARHLGDRGEEVEKLLPAILSEAGGFDGWRETACLSDSQALLAIGRREFSDLVETPLPAQHRISGEVGDRLCRFVSRYYPNMGFGARFSGYEGLDPDGVLVSADASLILHPELKAVFEQARRQPSATRTTATMKVIGMPIRRSSAYMLSLAQGIRAHSVRNLKRFESFHGRPHLPEDRTFPISGEHARDEHPSRVSLLSDYREIADRIYGLFRPPGAPRLPPGGEADDE